ncbi:MAG: molybdopterin molybdotransferase MoeA [Ferrimicrobium sp.]
MISLADAQARTMSHVVRTPAESILIGDSVGCFLADSITATEAIPPFANTAVDGFAVRAHEVTKASRDQPVQLRIQGTLAAGADPAAFEVGAGEAIRIMTGAAIPSNTSAIVMVEYTTVKGEIVSITRAPKEDEHIRHAGTDIQTGDVVLTAGTQVTPSVVGVLASLGIESVTVFRRARVGVLSTGDELSSEAVLAPGKIRDSNRPALLALVAQTGAVPVDLGSLPDDLELLSNGFSRAAASCDAVLTTGGVSVGDFDYTTKILRELSSGNMEWMQIAIKPAKPYAFGTIDGTPVFGLPGNPVSSLVSFELLARPAIRAMMGSPTPYPPTVLARALTPFNRRPDGRLHLVRSICQVDSDGHFGVTTVGTQGSHVLSGMAHANALTLLPDGNGAEANAWVSIIVLEPPWQATLPSSH